MAPIMKLMNLLSSGYRDLYHLSKMTHCQDYSNQNLLQAIHFFRKI